MPNWCSTAYAIEGNATELKKLYELMKDLEKRQKPSVQNGFGTTWLGCLVEALGESWEKIYCRGTWDNLKFNGEVLTFNTETAWSPCNEMFDMVCEKYPTLRYFYQSEEPGMCEYWTNDDEGKYFPDRYYVDVCTSEEEYYSEYFKTWKAYMTGWRIFAKYKSNPVRMSMRLSSNGKKKMKTHTALFTNIKYRHNRRA